MDIEVLLERDPVLSALGELVDGVCGAVAGTRLLVAGAGLGRSSLLDRAVRSATRRGLRVLRASGWWVGIP